MKSNDELMLANAIDRARDHREKWLNFMSLADEQLELSNRYVKNIKLLRKKLKTENRKKRRAFKWPQKFRGAMKRLTW